MEFQGIDLNTKYILKSTWDWLVKCVYELDLWEAPIEAHVYDNGFGMILLTYSADPEDQRIPIDLRSILEEAYEHDWRFIVLDSDGSDCDWLVSHEEEWN